MRSMPIRRARFVLTPRDDATSSPKFSRLSCLAVAKAATSPSTTNGAMPMEMVRSRPAMDPAFQKRIRSKLSSLVSTKALVMELSTADSAAPPSSTLNGFIRPEPIEVSEKTSKVARIAPVNATTTVPTMLVMPKNVNPTTTAHAAPELMPRTPGSASGLRVWP